MTARITRRSLLKLAGAGFAGAALGSLADLAVLPQRLALAAPPGLPDIQFDVGAYTAPARSVDGVPVRFGPVFTLFATYRLTRRPTVRDQAALERALATLESAYPFSAQGLFTYVGYGVPYFSLLPGGITGPLARSAIPRLLTDETRLAFEEAAPAPTDVTPANPSIVKQRFNLPVHIEQNHLLITFRSDSVEHVHDAMQWLGGSHRLPGAPDETAGVGSLLQVTSARVMFQQPGMPRRVAEQHRLPYADRINPQSPMWMGFADQQVAGAGPAPITTFQGTSSARLTTAVAGDYFDNASVQHLSHVVLDLVQFYGDDEPYGERVQYMFRSNPAPAAGGPDQFSDGGGPAFLDNTYQGSADAVANAEAGRLGHLTALQRSSRADDGTPMHIRIDGTGFDSLDVPDGSSQPKVQFSAFFPTAAFFAAMRTNQAALDLANRYDVAPVKNGIERFLTTTRRQNFLVPPRRHRSFPLLELAPQHLGRR